MTIAWKTLVITTLGCGAVMLPSVASPPPRLLWNASASVPIGLYRVQPEPIPKLSDIVVVRPPETLVGFLADGGYLPRGVPLLKHVAALGGQRVCRIGAAISIDGVTVGEALGHDRRGRPLPVWQGCTVLEMIVCAHRLPTPKRPSTPLKAEMGDPETRPLFISGGGRAGCFYGISGGERPGRFGVLPRSELRTKALKTGKSA